MRRIRPASVGLLTAGLLLTGLGAAQAATEVIRADFQSNSAFAGRDPVDFTGVESSAAAANSIFGSNGSNTWNYLTVDPAPSVTVNPSFDDLLDSSGNVTGVSIAFTGSISSANDTPIDNSGSNGVENDYFAIGGTTTVDYTISGLPADTKVAFYLYSPNFTQYDSGYPDNIPSRGYQLTANGDTITVPSGFGTENALAYVVTNASGDISGVWSSPELNEADWSGFQIGYGSPVPEPATWVMMLAGFGLLACAGARGARSRAAARA